MHVKSVQAEWEYNCNDCSYQAKTEQELKKHTSLTHHKKSTTTERSGENNLSCHSCGSEFKQRVMIGKIRHWGGGI